MIDDELHRLEVLAEHARNLGPFDPRLRSGFATSFEVLTGKNELFVTGLSRGDAKMVASALNAFPYLVSEVRRLQALSWQERDDKTANDDAVEVDPFKVAGTAEAIDPLRDPVAARLATGSVTSVEEREYWDKCVVRAIPMLPEWVGNAGDAGEEAFPRDITRLADKLLDERRKRFGGVK